MHRIQQQFCALFLIGIGALSAWPANTLAGQTLDGRYDRFMEVHEQTRGQSTAERATAMSAAFDNGFAAALARDPASMDSQDLATLFNAANIAHAYSIQATHLQAMQRAFGELQARGLVEQRSFSDMHAALMASRQFEQASALEKTFPQWNVEPAPTLATSSSSGKTALAVQESGNTLTRTTLAVDQGARVVVISHPLCHFSRNAMAAIEADPALSKAMARSLWLAPVDRKLNLDVLQQWNREHPEHPMVIAFDRAEWPNFDSWSTPMFYFLRDGKLVSVVEGWPSEGNKEALLKAANQIGL